MIYIIIIPWLFMKKRSKLTASFFLLLLSMLFVSSFVSALDKNNVRNDCVYYGGDWIWDDYSATSTGSLDGSFLPPHSSWPSINPEGTPNNVDGFRCCDDSFFDVDGVSRNPVDEEIKYRTQDGALVACTSSGGGTWVKTCTAPDSCEVKPTGGSPNTNFCTGIIKGTFDNGMPSQFETICTPYAGCSISQEITACQDGSGSTYDECIASGGSPHGVTCTGTTLCSGAPVDTCWLSEHCQFDQDAEVCNGLDDDCDGFADPNTVVGDSCSTGSGGSSCCSGLCVDGLCDSSCSSGDYGKGCSSTGVYYLAASGGTCTTSGCDYDGHTRMNCDSVCVVGTDTVYSSCDSYSGDACDDDAGGSFNQNGLCAIYSGSATCVSTAGHIILYNPGTNSYYSDSSFNLNGYDCDATLTNGDFSQEGIYCDGSCVGSSSSDCCGDDDCSGDLVCDLSDNMCKYVCYVDWDGDTFGSDLVRTTIDCSSGQLCDGGTGGVFIPNGMVVAFDSSFDGFASRDELLLFLFLFLF